MKTDYRFLPVPFLIVFIFFSALSAQADPFEVVSLRVEKTPEDCQSSLFVTIKKQYWPAVRFRSLCVCRAI